MKKSVYTLSGVFFINVFACTERGYSNEDPRLIVKIFGHVNDLERVRTHRVGYVEKCHNVSVKSGWRAKMCICLCGSPMQRCKRNGQYHDGCNLFATHLVYKCVVNCLSLFLNDYGDDWISLSLHHICVCIVWRQIIPNDPLHGWLVPKLFIKDSSMGEYCGNITE